MQVKNIMEEIVWDRMTFLLKDMDICKCEQCLSDIFTFALNLVEPKYVNTAEGGLFIKVDKTKIQNLVDIDVAITKAVEKVIENPRHN